MDRIRLPSDGRKERDERVAAYGPAVLTGLVSEVVQAGQGGRNAALNRAAHRAGRLAAGGLLSLDGAELALQDGAELALQDGAQAAGLPAREP